MYLKCCGIDFGTTNSAISVMRKDDSPTLVSFDDNKITIPTAIFFPESNTFSPLFGRKAVASYINGEQGRFMRSLKRILGTDLMDLKTEVNEIYLNYDDIIKNFINHLKETAQSQINNTLDSVVLGRPVHFQDFAPEEDAKAESMLKKIAHSIGFKNVSFQYEPIAAAFAHESKLEDELLACVIDIGGGTSDFSIIRLGGKSRQKIDRKNDILANTGIRIGGNDFDSDLSLKSFMPHFGYKTMLKPDDYINRILPIPHQPYVMLSEWSSVNSLYTYSSQKSIKEIYTRSAEPEKVINLYETIEKELGHNLLDKIEEGKILLSSNNKHTTTLSFLSNSPTITMDIESFETAILKNTQKIVSSLDECLSLAQITRKDIELIILTGGSTEIPYIKNSILNMFPNAQISQEDKLSSVALGLSHEAIRIYR
ncbi:MAG: Hsp70 family protein [Alphaproteobacteria bacterium]|nr:Hsp70 family protein [Alphaproteobacteria bacterium]